MKKYLVLFPLVILLLPITHLFAEEIQNHAITSPGKPYPPYRAIEIGYEKNYRIAQSEAFTAAYKFFGKAINSPVKLNFGLKLISIKSQQLYQEINHRWNSDLYGSLGFEYDFFITPYIESGVSIIDLILADDDADSEPANSPINLYYNIGLKLEPHKNFALRFYHSGYRLEHDDKPASFIEMQGINATVMF